MIVRYTPQPFRATDRPLVDIRIGHTEFEIKALADSGAINSLMDSEVAREAGIPLDDAEVRTLTVGAATYDARFVTVPLAAAGHFWEADVGFCDGWRHPWGLLGHDSFFRYFTVRFRAADLEFEIDPITN